jgi:hypothetical protein
MKKLTMKNKSMGNIMTYVIVCDEDYRGRFKIKFGKTYNWEKRYRIYQLHNQNIKDIIVFNGNFEDQLLFEYRENRIWNDETNYNTEWIDLDYNPLNEIINNYNILEPYFLSETKYETTCCNGYGCCECAYEKK